MSDLLDLAEIGEERIQLELSQRAQRRARGVCDYCERPPSEKPCRHPRRHRDPRIMYAAAEVVAARIGGAVGGYTCMCKFSDSWRCARERGLASIACRCACHVRQAPAEVDA